MRIHSPLTAQQGQASVTVLPFTCPHLASWDAVCARWGGRRQEPTMDQHSGTIWSRATGVMREKVQGRGAATCCCCCWSKPVPTTSPPRAPANRPDLRAGGAQDAKHTAKLFDVILAREERGPVQQLPHDAAYGPVDTEPQRAHSLTPWDRTPSAPAPHTGGSCLEVQTSKQSKT